MTHGRQRGTDRDRAPPSAEYSALMNLSDLPSVNALTRKLSDIFDLPTPVVTHACRLAIDNSRKNIGTQREGDPEIDATTMLTDIEASRSRSVINATGVLLHTNLGRAPLDARTARRSGEIHRSASNVEIDVRSGRRSKRHDYLGVLLPLVTHAEAGFAVNNNAGALLLALASVAGAGGRVAVSRGELIEIGGSFRLPDVMAASGVQLVEVGSTNRTLAGDFAAVAGSVDAILKVHPSNYRIDGFKQEASYGELADIASSANIPLVADVGSGLIDEGAPWLGEGDRTWVAHEPGVIQTVAAGADLVLFSGDKLLGGPQCGVIVGSSEAVRNAMAHPIARAVRLDGGSIAAVADTFEMYANQRVLDIPFWRMAAATLDEIESRAVTVLEGTGLDARIVDAVSVPGAGSVPGETIPTKAIQISGDVEQTWARLAGAATPVIGTRRDGAVFVDLRSVLPQDDPSVSRALMGLSS